MCVKFHENWLRIDWEVREIQKSWLTNLMGIWLYIISVLPRQTCRCYNIIIYGGSILVGRGPHSCAASLLFYTYQTSRFNRARVDVRLRKRKVIQNTLAPCGVLWGTIPRLGFTFAKCCLHGPSPAFALYFLFDLSNSFGCSCLHSANPSSYS